MATAVAEEVISDKPVAEEPPLASVMEKPYDVVKDKPLAPPPHHDAMALTSFSPKGQKQMKKVTKYSIKIGHDLNYGILVLCADIDQEVPEPAAKKASKGSLDRDIALAKLDGDKKLSYIKAWEENEKCKVENKAQKKLSDVAAWENSKRAALESELKSIEEKVEKKKAEYAEKLKNRVALVHKQAEEKRAMVDCKRGENMLKAEETAAKFRATGQVPSRGFACFGG